MPKHGSMLLYVHRNHTAHQDGEPRAATSTLTQLLNSVYMSELVEVFVALRPRKPEGSLGGTTQDDHLDSHTAPELCVMSEWRVTLHL